jgi:pimeloyl-ACP methyl ester carboxylesterase
MLGGGTGGAADFAPHAQMLAKDFCVLRPQSPRFESRPLPPDYSIKMESAALARAVEQSGIREPLALIGHSFGAVVALDFALDHPDRVRVLVLAEPPAFWVVPPEDLHADAKMEAMVALLGTLGPSVEPTDDQLVKFRSLNGREVKPPSQGTPDWETWVSERSALRGLAAVSNHRDDPRRLKALRTPVLIVTGKDTVAFLRRINDVLAARLPVVERIELPGGHRSPYTAPDEFVAKLREFFARHPD